MIILSYVVNFKLDVDHEESALYVSVNLPRDGTTVRDVVIENFIISFWPIRVKKSRHTITRASGSVTVKWDKGGDMKVKQTHGRRRETGTKKKKMLLSQIRQQERKKKHTHTKQICFLAER